MRAEVGKKYVVTVQTSDMIGGVDWVYAAFGQHYQATVLGSGAAKPSGAGLRVEVLVEWRDSPVEIAIGDQITGPSLPSSPVVPTATVVGIGDADKTPITTVAATGFELLGAAAIVAFIAYAVNRRRTSS